MSVNLRGCVHTKPHEIRTDKNPPLFLWASAGINFPTSPGCSQIRCLQSCCGHALRLQVLLCVTSMLGTGVCVCRSKDISVTTRGRPKQRIPGVSQMDFIPTPCVCACALSRSSGPVLCSARRSCSAPEGRGTSATPPACRSSGSKTSHWMVSQTCHQWDSIVNMTGVCVCV